MNRPRGVAMTEVERVVVMAGLVLSLALVAAGLTGLL